AKVVAAQADKQGAPRRFRLGPMRCRRRDGARHFGAAPVWGPQQFWVALDGSHARRTSSPGRFLLWSPDSASFWGRLPAEVRNMFESRKGSGVCGAWVAKNRNAVYRPWRARQCIVAVRWVARWSEHLATRYDKSRQDIGGVVGPKLARLTSDRRSGRHEGWARPSARSGG